MTQFKSLIKAGQTELKPYAQGEKFATVYADPPWRFDDRTFRGAPEEVLRGKLAASGKQSRFQYPTMSIEEICALPVKDLLADNAHIYLWVPNALINQGMQVIEAWGFKFKTLFVWYKISKDLGPATNSGLGYYFRNVTELMFFGVRGRLKTAAPARKQENIVVTRKERHSKKPDLVYDIIERCSPGPYLEMFARQGRTGWTQYGNECPVITQIFGE